MHNLYVWRTRPELVRFIAITVVMYFVQIAPTLVDDVTTAPNPWKVAISLLVAGTQFVGARILALPNGNGSPPTDTTPREWRSE